MPRHSAFTKRLRSPPPVHSRRKFRPPYFIFLPSSRLGSRRCNEDPPNSNPFLLPRIPFCNEEDGLNCLSGCRASRLRAPTGISSLKQLFATGHPPSLPPFLPLSALEIVHLSSVHLTDGIRLLIST